MTLNELVQGLADHLQIEPLEADSRGVFEVVFDDSLEIELLALTSSQLLLRGKVADVPTEVPERDGFYRQHLQRNLMNLRGQNCSLSLDEERTSLWLFCLQRIDSLDLRVFCELVEEFLNSLEWWKQIENSDSGSPMNAPGMMPFPNIIRP